MPPSPASPSILIVDDQPANIKVLFELLQQEGFRISVAKSGESALMKAQETSPDLILLDIMMPGMNGYETCAKLKDHPLTQGTPVIFLSALDQAINKVTAFSIGGADYITKPFQAEEVLARVRHQLALRWAQAEIVSLNATLEARIQERTAQLLELNQTLAAEIVERKRVEDALRHSALHDALTTLPNRVLFTEHLEMAQQRAKRSPDYQFAVLFIDLDRFKYINDSLGHHAGDQLLIQVADRLRNLVRGHDILARLGGDEFIILLDQILHLEEAKQVADRIVQAFQQPFQLNEHPVTTTASVGVALSSALEDQGIDLLRNADIAMYRAKGSGKGRLEIFDQQMYLQTLARHQLEKDLRRAVEQQEFSLDYQPIFALANREICGFEALIRWSHPQRGRISPEAFIPMAEEIGLIVPLGAWALQQACQQLAQWQSQCPAAASLYVSVNLSMAQLREASFMTTIDQALAQSGILPSCLQLELTESMLMDGSEALVTLLQGWADDGIRLSIDDFGTGYSSLSYLHRFPVHSIKVDQSFVNSMLQQREKRKIVETIIHLAHQLGIEAIAEGIESVAQLDYLKLLNCEKGQGYSLSKPLPSDAAELLITEHFVPSPSATLEIGGPASSVLP
ncbi:two-component system response regulator [Lyngbya confervoides]|uniref:EAL domain-containing protein n=1 Tax=Lyngbya confervoides BDU141951 TaxID=1574623 RepID=A0ABD4T0X2_9CYAN|nr:EAL domain-containing protein [Lyngbya confervoides]MCM1982080.1 EAL domain-containing protein [Lyngbya confervoides BDU141951]